MIVISRFMIISDSTLNDWNYAISKTLRTKTQHTRLIISSY